MPILKTFVYLVFGLVVSIGSLLSNPESVTAQTSQTEVSEADFEAAIEKTLRQHPELIFRALEQDPVMLADLAERGVELRKAKVEEARWRAELAHPKVPQLTDNRPVRGARQAPVTIVEYSDFECPYCRAVSPTLQEVLTAYGDAVRLVYKHNPLSFHTTAEPAARYFEAIALQSEEQAWRFHDLVFQQQRSLSRGIEVLKEIASVLEVDQARLERDLQSDTVSRRIAADRAEAEQFGFDGTPAFVINGVSLIGNHPKQDFDRIIKKMLPDTHAMAR
ncbi:MAG: thioredoxin domain-containing protein [Nitrospira sp.]|nr:thioredoxin domain-containing protein [Nitrospira sp.]